MVPVTGVAIAGMDAIMAIVRAGVIPRMLTLKLIPLRKNAD
jgi:hypothetical protein